MSDSLLDLLAEQLVAFLAPLTRTVQHPDELQGLLAEIGSTQSADPALVSTVASITALTTQLETLAVQSDVSFDTVQQLVDLSQRAVSLTSTLTDTGSASNPLQGLGRDLVELLIMRWLLSTHSTARDIAALLTLIEPAEEQAARGALIVSGTVVRAPFRLDRFHFDRIGSVLRDPLAVLRAEYTNAFATDADANAIADKLFPRLVRLLRGIGINCRYGINPNDAAILIDSAPLLAHSLIIYVDGVVNEGRSEAGLMLTLSPASRGDLGLVISPFGTLDLTRQFGLWTIELTATAGVDLVAWGRHGVTLVSDAGSTELAGSVTATLTPVDPGPAFVFGSSDGTRLEIGGAKLNLATQLSSATQSFGVSADVTKSALVIAPGDGDGFLSDVLPTGGVRAAFDLGVSWATNTGLRFRGSASLDATVPVDLAIGPVTLTAVHLSLLAQASGSIDAEVSVDVGVAIGPVQASIERVGLTSTLSFPATGGNLGVADLALGLKAPSGVGVALDAHGVLTGGGFLLHDAATGTYAGVLQLALHDEITLTAVGLLATRLPDGRAGYSLLVFITADGFQPIPLGFGFVLQSIGGLVGIHRTFDQAALTAGLKSDTLRTLLFPRDPVGNAPALLQALGAAFPVQRGSYLLGLLARLTWFTPTLVTIDVALVLELGLRTRLLVLGRISALLPSADNDLIRLNLDAIGVLDFDAGTLSADAVLVDSRLVHQFPITGSAALRARWSGDPSVVLAVGGLNPHFAAPAGFPTLERVAIALCSGSNPRLVCDSYFAITANTVQFGARASLYAAAAGFSVTGDLGFDALVTLVPPHFIIDFRASMQLKRGSHNLFGISLAGTLEGPLPLRLAAKVKIEILFFSCTVHFDYTLADGPASQLLPPAVTLLTELTKALAAPTSWATRRASDTAQGVALRALPAGTASTTVLDPLGQLVVQQQVVPLNTTRDITTFGGAPVDGPTRFQVVASLNGQHGTAVSGEFAPARYFPLTDDEKLTAPSFETMDAGMVVGDETTRYDAGTIVPAPLTYFPVTLAPLGNAGSLTAPVMTVAAGGGRSTATTAGGVQTQVQPQTLAPLFTPLAAPPLAAPVYVLPSAAFDRQRPSGAAAHAPVRRVGRARFRDAGATPAVTVGAPGWRIVRVSDGDVAPVAPGVTTWSEYRDALADLNRGGAEWVMVPDYESV